MNYRYLIFIISITFLSACKTIQPTQISQSDEIKTKIEQFVSAINSRDKTVLKNLIHSQYQGIAPIIEPENIDDFANDLIDNMEKNNFEININIKSVEMGVITAFSTMDWQIKSRESEELFVKVHRMDIWKKDKNNWKLFRTLIYNEKAF